MQPNQAPNETRLPHQVVRRSAAITARYTKPDEPAALNPAEQTQVASANTSAETQTPAANADPRDTDPAYWKQRWSVTSGILNREREDRKTQVTALNQQLSELQEKSRTPQVSAAAPKVDLSTFFTEDQRKAYGDEQLEAMAQTAMKAAEAKSRELIDAAVKPLQQEREQAKADQVTLAKQRFVDRLVELYPNYAAVDVDPRWLAWLSEEDDNGVQRQTILDIHIRKGNADACAKMFKAWEKTATRPAPTVSPSGSGASPGNDAAPPDTAAVTGMTPLKPGEIKAFYTRAAQNKVTDSERATFDARLKLTHASR